MEPYAVLLGNRITAARERRGWSRADLARHASVDPSYVTRIEEAKYKRPSVDKVKRLADALSIAVTDLTDTHPSVAPDLIEQVRLLVNADEDALRDVLAALATRTPVEQAAALRFWAEAMRWQRSSTTADTPR